MEEPVRIEGKNKIFDDPSRKEIVTKTGRRLLGYKTSRELGREIADVKLKSEGYHEDSLTDTLTRLPNRRHLEQRLDTLVAEENPQFVALMIDIDHFKSFNDKYGHKVGDEALQFVVKHLLSHTRHPDILARYGGEEFAAILPGKSDDQDVLSIAKRFQVGIDELNNDPQKSFKVRKEDGTQEPVRLTVSIGATEYYDDTDEKDWNRTLIRADMALYEAKFKRNDTKFIGHLGAWDLGNHVTELRRNEE